MFEKAVTVVPIRWDSAVASTVNFHAMFFMCAFCREFAEALHYEPDFSE